MYLPGPREATGGRLELEVASAADGECCPSGSTAGLPVDGAQRCGR